MGRKGGGRAGFFKASRKGPGSDDEEEVAVPAAPAPKEVPKAPDAPSVTAEPAKPTISKKAAAFLVSTGDGSDDSSDDDDQGRSAGGETRGQMVQRHKREAKILKEQTKKLGKKGKDEAAKLEAEMKSRHQSELASIAAPGTASAVETIALADSLYAAKLDDKDSAAPKTKKPTKAQRRREQKAERDAEREARIAAEVAELGETERMAEEKELKKLLIPHGLAVKDIPPDGHCLYRSLEDQLTGLPDGGAAALAAAGCKEALSFLALRQVAAQYMRKNAEHFRHFIGEGDAVASAAGDGAVAAESAAEGDSFEVYCSQVENTAAWGGHVEIEALSRALQLHIKVFTVGLPTLEMGEEFKDAGRPTVQLCYLRHAYGLGEHYNSVKKYEKKVTFEGQSSSEEEESSDEE